MASAQMFAPGQSRLARGGMANNNGSSNRGGRNVRFQTGNPFEVLATVAEDGSDGSSSTQPSTSSGGSLSQVDHNHSGRGSATPSQTLVDVHTVEAARQLPDTPRQVHRMTIGESNTSSPLTSPHSARMQAAQQYDSSPQRTALKRLVQLQGSGTQHHGSHASHTSENWRSPRRPSTISNPGISASSNPVDAFHTTSMSGVPEYLAVQELAFRRGQDDHGGSRNGIPSSPFAKHFDHVWAEHYKLGSVFGGVPAVRPTATSSSRENFAWSVLINPATQDLDDPNGSIDMEWARNICIMALNSMKELICVVCKRPADWRKYVCDIPSPVQQVIVVFPDLSAHYEALKQDAQQALGGGIPAGY
ncbi:hypothetical protein BDW02DRAFT_14882 [Decorospora gaudefroyi]|uniref:Uncharacterized protein n=1 Tax=Decorospora gaudefroyi TaxID=184978 RepID=A0A6A5KUV3_9PLEO|nr:hypothetical protein BDW02DRAFT_14882 [Decorospora gaudefroyi]